jgi:hypothetical protein
VLILPEGAVIFRAQGTQVALVDSTDRVHLVPVQVGTIYGTTMEILSGLKPDDRVVNNPPAGLLNGDKVRIVPGTRGYNIPVYPPATTGLLAPSAVVPASASALQGDAPPMSGPGLRHGHLSGPPGHGRHDGPRDNVRAMPEERFVPEAGGQR